MKLDKNRKNKFDLSKVDDDFLEKSLEFFESPSYKDFIDTKAILNYEPSDFVVFLCDEELDSIIKILNQEVELPPYDGREVITLHRDEIKKFFGKI